MKTNSTFPINDNLTVSTQYNWYSLTGNFLIWTCNSGHISSTICKLVFCRWLKKWATTTASWRTGFEQNVLLIPRSWTQTYDGDWTIWQLDVTMIYHVMILDIAPKCLVTPKGHHLHCPVSGIYFIIIISIILIL